MTYKEGAKYSDSLTVNGNTRTQEYTKSDLAGVKDGDNLVIYIRFPMDVTAKHTAKFMEDGKVITEKTIDVSKP